jgi:hypothetical protein
MRARSTTAALGAGLVLMVTGCAADAGEFRSQAEQFLESSEMSDIQGEDFTDAECEEPRDTVIGTTFRCTALDDDEDLWRFTVEITSDSSIVVRSGRQVR